MKMFSSTIDNALVAYVKNCTSLSKVLWAYQNSDEEKPPFCAIQVLGVQDIDGLGGSSATKHKAVSIRFDVQTLDDSHILTASKLFDLLDDENIRIGLEVAGVSFIGALTDVTDATEINGAYYRYRAFIDLRFGMVFTNTIDYGQIDRVSGTVFDIPFDVGESLPEED